MRVRGKVDRNQSEVVKAARQLGCRVLSLAPLGKGAPDLLIADRRNVLRLVEVKDGSKPPSARQLTPEQAVFHSQWPVTVVSSVDELLALLK